MDVVTLMVTHVVVASTVAGEGNAARCLRFTLLGLLFPPQTHTTAQSLIVTLKIRKEKSAKIPPCPKTGDERSRDFPPSGDGAVSGGTREEVGVLRKHSTAFGRQP